jgi:hypothetical protein
MSRQIKHFRDGSAVGRPPEASGTLRFFRPPAMHHDACVPHGLQEYCDFLRAAETFRFPALPPRDGSKTTPHARSSRRPGPKAHRLPDHRGALCQKQRPFLCQSRTLRRFQRVSRAVRRVFFKKNDTEDARHPFKSTMEIWRPPDTRRKRPEAIRRRGTPAEIDLGPGVDRGNDAGGRFPGTTGGTVSRPPGRQTLPGDVLFFRACRWRCWSCRCAPPPRTVAGAPAPRRGRRNQHHHPGDFSMRFPPQRTFSTGA